MGLQGLNFQPLHIPFSAGLNTKGDPRAQQPPLLDVCDDVQFDNIGGLETRYPFAPTGSNIQGGGTISAARRLVNNNGEWLLFTVDTLYSWDAAHQVWAPKGTHLAATVDEKSVATSTGDQYDCDRAELNGVVVYTWTEYQSAWGTPTGMISAVDAVTGAVLLPPMLIPNSSFTNTVLTIKLVPLATKIAMFFNFGHFGVSVIIIDPANLSTSIAVAPTTVPGSAGTTFGSAVPYDVTRLVGSDAAIGIVQTTSGSYTVFTVTAAGAFTSSAKARVANSTMAIACAPDGLHVQVVRSSASAVTGDLIAVSGLADVSVNQALGSVSTGPNQIACAYQSVQTGGHYRCYTFWEYSPGATPVVVSTWANDAGTVNPGGATTFIGYINLASRAFDYNGRVYVWGCFSQGNGAWSPGAALQNTYFLWRDDLFLVAKAVAGTAAPPIWPGRLPNVQSTASTAFAWCGMTCRIIDLNGASGYAQRAPRDITFTFDDDDARRCVRIGNTLYIPGGQILQYDGAQITEVGFPLMPWAFAVFALGSGGHLSDGAYAVKSTFRWENAAGDLDRSSTTSLVTVTCVASDELEYLGIAATPVTRKVSPPIAIEAWRTVVNPGAGAPFYLQTSKNPAISANPNRYLANTTTGAAPFAGPLTDTLSDASISQLESNPENGAVLPNICPPAARIIFATDTRVFLAGIAGLSDTVQYSQQRNDGEVVKFNDALTIQVPNRGGTITAIFQYNGAIVVARATAMYLYTGDGFDNTGGGTNYTLSTVISSDLGVESMDAWAIDEDGVFLKTNKGWYVLDRGFALHYVGASVDLYDGEPVLAVHAMTSRHQLRVLTANRMLVLDTLVNQWSRWSVANGVHAELLAAGYAVLTAAGPSLEQSTYAGLTYGMDIETSWTKVADLQGRGLVRTIEVLGEYRSPHYLRFRVARDYRSDGAGGWLYHYDKTWPVTPAVVGGPEQASCGPSQKRCEAIKVRLTALATDGTTNPPTGEALRLTGIALDVGIEPGLYRGLPAAQKV